MSVNRSEGVGQPFLQLEDLLLAPPLAAFVLVVSFGQPTPRFFLDPYLWCAAAAAAAPWRPLKSLFFKELTAQALVTTAVALYLGSVLLSGALTQAGRDRIMTKMAIGYTEAKWLDATLPLDAVVLTEGRSHALTPRPFVVVDRFHWGPLTHDKNEQLTVLLRERKVTVLVSQYPINDPAYAWLADRYGTLLACPAEFHFAARSPFNRGHLIRSIAMRLDVHASRSHVE